MNWIARGKHGKRSGGLRIIGGADTEEGVREALQGSHPDFVVESLAPLTAEQPDPEPVEAEAPKDVE